MPGTRYMGFPARWCLATIVYRYGDLYDHDMVYENHDMLLYNSLRQMLEE